VDVAYVLRAKVECTGTPRHAPPAPLRWRFCFCGPTGMGLAARCRNSGSAHIIRAITSWTTEHHVKKAISSHCYSENHCPDCGCFIPWS
jgi:hypothetical protein